MLQQIDAVRAQEIASLTDFGIVFVIVNGAGIVRVGDNPQQLEQIATEGIPFTAATPPQQSFIFAIGRVWAISNANTPCSIVVFRRPIMPVNNSVLGAKAT